MKKLILLALTAASLFETTPVLAARIAIARAEQFTVRRFDGTSLPKTNEKMPQQLYVDIPDQFVKRDKRGDVIIEESLEAWRMGSRVQNGSPLVYPGGLGDCSYNFGGKRGCDMYPYKNEQGEIRYFAMRFMAREAEKDKLDESDFLTMSIPDSDGNPGEPETTYNRSVFMEITRDGAIVRLKKPVDLQAGKKPKPIIRGGTKGFVKSEEAAIKGYVDYTEADAEKGVTCEGPQNPLQCLICNCHHETGITNDADKLAVGKVVMTRMGMKTYNKGGKQGVCDMIYEHKSQFSWFFDGKKEEVVRGNNFKTCLPLMKKALAFRGHFASHYHANWMAKGDVMWLKTSKGTPNCRGKTTVLGTKTLGHTFYELCDPGRTHAQPAQQLRGLGVTQ